MYLNELRRRNLRSVNEKVFKKKGVDKAELLVVNIIVSKKQNALCFIQIMEGANQSS